jgi:hypothetical protein
MKSFVALLLSLASLTTYAHPGGHDDEGDDRPAGAQPAPKPGEAAPKKPAVPPVHKHKKTDAPAEQKSGAQKAEEKKQ